MPIDLRLSERINLPSYTRTMLVSVERWPLAALDKKRLAQMLSVRRNQGTLEIFPPGA